MTDPSHWTRRFRAYARDLERPNFTKHHGMVKAKTGLVFRTTIIRNLYRNMFAVLPDGRVFGWRGKEVDYAVLVAWFEDEKGLTDVC